MTDPSKTLFVGWDDTEGVTHYRTILPAKAMGAEYVVFDMAGKGVARSGTNKKHDIIVVQHCWTPWQTQITRNMRKMGAFTVINVDDWVKTIAKMGDSHMLSKDFKNPALIKEHYSLIREADGVLAATPWLERKLSVINKNTHLARNGLDLERYERWAKPEKEDDTVILGWAGGTGHVKALTSIVPAIVEVMTKHKNTRLHLVGDNHKHLFPKGLADRVKHIAWSDMQFYPRHLAEFDINLAPADDNDFFKAKSQLRFYEACAMGTPTIGHTMYAEIGDWGAHGFKCRDLGDWSYYLDTLITHPRMRNEMRTRCRAYAQSVAIEQRITEWEKSLTAMTSPSRAS